MNKKIMALAVASALAAPAVVLAQASNVQIFGTMYMEYAGAHQGQAGAASLPNTFTKSGGQSSSNFSAIAANGDLQNVDILQSPGSEVGVKGEEALGGGNSVWFQCASTADIRGAGTGGGIQGFCGRNSAIGLKTAMGNAYMGNWDMPMKRTAGAVRIVSDTGIWGAGPLLFGNSTSLNAGASPTVFSRRQNGSLFYDSPVFSGFQAFAGISTTGSTTANQGITQAQSGAKPRAWGLAANYSNGPLLLTAGYENHSNFRPTGGAIVSASGAQVNEASGLVQLDRTVAGGLGGSSSFAGTDSGFQLGGRYQFGPVKVGLLYTNQRFDTGIQNGLITATANTATELKVTAFNLAGEWAIVGPHALRGGYTKAHNTSGNYGGGTAGALLVGNRVANGGAGQTGATIQQVQYVYNASKRTEMTAGYVALRNDANARYSLGGLAVPTAGTNQSAFAVSIKTTY